MMKANILVVGAGGIGCELLKNLVLEDYRNITIIDLDTIDISNLNRQFLFNKVHVGRPKAQVARESVLKFRPDCNIVAYHKSIFSSSFDSEFFCKFDIVCNALDNQAARRHVNRLCVASKRPLIESGTAGYLGQVEPFLPTGLPEANNPTQIDSSGDHHDHQQQDVESPFFRTGCFECQPRGAGQRTYPACTIRNTPSEPIHCVVWAKYLFNQLFGEPDVDDEDISPDLSDPELAMDPKLSVSTDRASTVINGDKNRTKTSLRDWFDSRWAHQNGPSTTIINAHSATLTAVRSLAWRLFHQDIVTLVGMRDLWVDRKDRREPTPLDEATLENSMHHEAGLDPAADDLSKTVRELRDQRHLSLAGWLRLFLDSVSTLKARCDASPTHVLTWDKDDTDAMDFVTAASIVRAHIFYLHGADQLTRFGIKSLAGNIIPAIATTNAIIAGLMVLQAKQILASKPKRIHSVYLHRRPTGRPGRRRLVVPCEPASASPNCLVCSDKATKSQLGLVCDPASLTLRTLRDRILVRHLGMLAPDVELVDRNAILISSEEGETDESTLDKTLSDFQILHGSRLQCDDFRQEFNLTLVISTDLEQHRPSANSTMQDPGDFADWCLVGDLESLLADASALNSGLVNFNHSVQPNDIETTILSDEEGITTVGETAAKRQHSANPDGPINKRARTDDVDASHCVSSAVNLEDDDDDLIFLD